MPAAEPLSAALPILNADLDDEEHTFEEFTHPDGVHLDPDTRYWIVISQTTPLDDGSIGVSASGTWEGSLKLEGTLNEGTPEVVLGTPPVDPGSEDGWSVDLQALSYYWDDPNDPVYPALFPWHLFATALNIPDARDDGMVLRMSLVAPPVVTVQFSASDYTVDEGNSVSVEVELSSDPKSTITIPITAMGEGGATSADYSVPQSVTFNRGETTKTVTFTATQDTVDDDGESVKLVFGSMPHSGVSSVTPNETTVSITDDDDPFVTVQFGASDYTVAEGRTQTVTVGLDVDPERTVIIPIETMGEDGATSADYSVPASVTFNSGDTSKTITFTAVDDTVDDDDESVLLAFGTMPDERVSPGTTDEVTLDITDDDDPFVTVQFGATGYTVAEGGTQTVTVSLNADPERTVIIPIETRDRGGATSADYSGVPSSLTFNSGDMSKSFTFTATQDTVDDDEESVLLEFGTMPDNRVSPGATDQVTLEITDDDHPEVQVQRSARRQRGL